MLEEMPDRERLDRAPEPLFLERGASWYWLLTGPLSAATMALIQIKGGMGFQPAVPLLFLVLVSGFLGLQVKAARIHTSVEITRDTLRQGTEVIPIDEIVEVFPEPTHSVKSGGPIEKWQSARALGELTGVPRGRTGVGIKLTGGRTAQAWARKHRQFRAVLTELVDGNATP